MTTVLRNVFLRRKKPLFSSRSPLKEQYQEQIPNMSIVQTLRSLTFQQGVMFIHQIKKLFIRRELKKFD